MNSDFAVLQAIWNSPETEIEKILDGTAKNPWPKWSLKLLGKIFKTHFPTLDEKKGAKLLGLAVKRCLVISAPTTDKNEAEKLVSEFYRDLEKAKSSIPEFARFLGHLNALLDNVFDRSIPLHCKKMLNTPAGANLINAMLKYFRARIPLDSETEKAIPQCLKFLKSAYLAPLGMIKENLPFDQKAEFHSEFGKAYAMTLTPDGQFRSRTKATDLYFRLLTHAIAWPITGRPASIAELNRRMNGHSEKELSAMSPLQRLQCEDELKSMEIRLQQICHRIGLKLRAQPFKPLKSNFFHKKHDTRRRG